MDDIRQRAEREGTPLIDGERVTFVWEGSVPPVVASDLDGFGEHGEPLTMQEQAPGVWTRTIDLPRDAYLEYIFLVGGRRVRDPWNDRLTPNGMGAENHFFAMPERRHTTLIERQPGVPAGTLSSRLIERSFLVAGGSRTLHLYRPPADGPVPLLLVFDALDYLDRAMLPVIADNLIAGGRVRPFAMALIEHGDQARFIEYNCSESTLGLITTTILPLAREHLDLIDASEMPGAHTVLGASMGGLMATYTALRLPQLFGQAISQSGAFLFEYAGSPSVVRDLVRYQPRPNVRLWLDAGWYEWLLASNRSMRDLLAERGYDLTYREFPGGHNYTSWRDELPAALEWAFAR